MRLETVPFLLNPRTGNPLRLESAGRQQALVDSQTGERFLIQSGIPIFIKDAARPAGVQAAQKWFDLLGVAFTYDWRVHWGLSKKGIDERQMRIDFLKRLEIKAGDRILETSVGTGSNFQYCPDTTELYGVDVSWKMLLYAQRNLRKWKRPAELFFADASAKLPFKDEAFEVVFHMAGIQYFDNPKLGIREMIRVAKPGTKILVADESHTAPATLRRAGIQNDHPDAETALKDLPGLLPDGLSEVSAEIIARGELYCLSFRKPL